MKVFKLLESLLERAAQGGIALKTLSMGLPMLVPFNHGHGYRILQVGDTQATQVRIPYRRSNHNHLRGIHACALATGAELCAGLSILASYPASRYRIIMSDLRCHYSFQARSHCIASVLPLSDEQKALLEAQLLQEQKAFIEVMVEIKDQQQEVVASAAVLWQIKEWEAITKRTQS